MAITHFQLKELMTIIIKTYVQHSSILRFLLFSMIILSHINSGTVYAITEFCPETRVTVCFVGLVQDCSKSIANAHWSYCSLALSHRFDAYCIILVLLFYRNVHLWWSGRRAARWSYVPRACDGQSLGLLQGSLVCRLLSLMRQHQGRQLGGSVLEILYFISMKFVLGEQNDNTSSLV